MIVARSGAISVLARGAVPSTCFTGDDVIAHCYVVEHSASSLRKLVQPRIEVAQPRAGLNSIVHHVLIEKRDYPGEERRAGRGATCFHDTAGHDDEVRVVFRGCCKRN